ncbi:MAG: hypothetical protein QNJ63_03415 [Calothrix sp. MO_192.B10]|nr:hypothetical protein [Calothrix sp. MO_192.B10]
MKEVLDLIEQKKQEFAQLPFFDYLLDTGIDPKQRLIWSNCLSYFVMFFGELNNDFLRQESTDNPLQQLINQHAYEDEQHWLWFLEDLEKLGFNPQIKFTDALRFLWGQETKKTRNLSYEIMTLCNIYPDPVLRLVIIETLEATGNATLSITAEVSQEINKITQDEYRYFGSHHVDFETGHLIGTDDVYYQIENIQLAPEKKQEAFQIVEKLFAAFNECTYEWMNFAQNHDLQSNVNVFFSPQSDGRELCKQP